MPTHARDGTQFQTAKRVYVHNGAGFQTAKKVFVHNGAGWQLSYVLANPVTPTGSGQTYRTTFEGDATCSLTIKSDGSLQIRYGDGGTILGGQWLDQILAGAGPAFFVRFSGFSGAGTSNGASTWTQVSSDLVASVTSVGTMAANGPFRAIDVLVEIAATSGGAVLASGTIRLEAQGLRIL